MTDAEHEAAAREIVARVALAINGDQIFPTDYARRVANAKAASALSAISHEDLTTWQEWVKRPFPAAEPMVG